jgi:hypothetical protein
MEGMHEMGHKRQLIVVPANLREQMYKDACGTKNADGTYADNEAKPTWLAQDMRDNVHGYNPRISAEARRVGYAKDGIHIIGHEQLRTDADALAAAGFDAVFVDEAHRLTSPEGDAEAVAGATKQYEGLMKLQGVKNKVMLSGTNVKNSMDELYKKVNWIDPSHTLGSMEDFRKKYEEVNQGTGIFKSASVEAFRKEMAPYLYEQRNKLPVKHNEVDHSSDLADWQMQRFREINSKYVAERDSAKDAIGKSAAASRRDAAVYAALNNERTDNPKIKAAIDILEGKHQGEKAIFHVRQKNTLRTMKKALEEKYGPGCVRIIIGGGSSGTAEGGEAPLVKESHEKAKKDFINDPKVRFLIGTSAMSTGHDGLQQVARTQFNIDLPQTYAEYEQRNARLNRTGQESEVFTYNLSTPHAYDIQARDIVRRKKAKHEMLGNPSEVSSWDESGFHEQLERAGFFAPAKEA